MKKLSIVVLLCGFMMMTAGCSRTWSGVKQDSSEIYQDTKEVIHEATA